MAYITTVPTRDRDQWIAQLRTMMAMSDTIGRKIMDRARQTALAAGCDLPSVHNILADLHYGRPRTGINYSLVRRADWLRERSYEARRIVDRWYERTYWQANPHAVQVGCCLTCGYSRDAHDMPRTWENARCDDFIAATERDGEMHA